MVSQRNNENVLFKPVLGSLLNKCTGLAACGLLGGSTCIGRGEAKGVYTGEGSLIDF